MIIKEILVTESTKRFTAITGYIIDYNNYVNKSYEGKILKGYKGFVSDRSLVMNLAKRIFDRWEQRILYELNSATAKHKLLLTRKECQAWNVPVIEAEPPPPPQKKPGVFDDIQPGDKVSLQHRFGRKNTIHSVSRITKTRFIIEIPISNHKRSNEHQFYKKDGFQVGHSDFYAETSVAKPIPGQPYHKEKT